jgi:hypothetical protein
MPPTLPVERFEVRKLGVSRTEYSPNIILEYGHTELKVHDSGDAKINRLFEGIGSEMDGK